MYSYFRSDVGKREQLVCVLLSSRRKDFLEEVDGV
jgi:hypothetical protein